MLMVRALILPYVPPKELNIWSLDFKEGVLGKPVLMMLNFLPQGPSM